MANLSATNVRDVTDCWARAYDLMAALLGSNETTNDTWRKAAKKVWDIGLAAADTAEAQSPLTNVCAYANEARSAFVPSSFIKDRLSSQVNGLITECDGNLGNFLDDNDVRVHPSFGDLFYLVTGARLSPITCVFPPSQVLGSVARSAGTWTFSAGTDVDVTKYGGAQLQIRATHLIGAADAIVTLTCQKFDGGTEQQVVTMPSGSAIDTLVDVGDSADLYVAVTTASVSGGTNADAIDIETKLTRAIASILTG